MQRLHWTTWEKGIRQTDTIVRSQLNEKIDGRSDPLPYVADLADLGKV